MVDLSDTIVPKSDQMNAEDLLSGPRTFTIREVKRVGSGDDQPVAIYLEEFPAGRPFKPSKTVRRILVAAWGPEAANYTGRRLTLYRDPAVKWGGQEVGGIRISHLSHIDRRLSIALTETRGRRVPHRIEPLPADAPVSPAVSERTLDELLAQFMRLGIPDDKQLAGVNHYTGGSATALEVVTEAEAQQVIGILKQRPDATPAAVVEVPADIYLPQAAHDAMMNDLSEKLAREDGWPAGPVIKP